MCQSKHKRILKKGSKKIILIAVIIIFSITLKAQDIHFSQVGNSPLNISPALTAVFNGDVRAVANYKSQWQSVPVSFMTFSGSFEKKFVHSRLPNSLFGGGLIFDHDRAGHGDLSLSRLGLNLAYTQQLSRRLFITGGFQFSIAQRMFKPQQLSFDSQYIGDKFDAGTDSGEVFENPSFVFLNYTGGLNVHYQLPSKRARLDFGVSGFNLNQANQSFYDKNDVRLLRRTHIYALGSVMLGEKVDIVGLGLVSLQDTYSENVFGVGFKFYLSDAMSKELSLQLGANLRIGDAVIPNIEIEYRNTYKVAISYDVNVSDFNAATSGKGSPEFSFFYTLKEIKPLEQTKICPLY